MYRVPSVQHRMYTNARGSNFPDEGRGITDNRQLSLCSNRMMDQARLAGVDGSRTHRSRVNRLPTILKTVESTGTQLPPNQRESLESSATKNLSHAIVFVNCFTNGRRTTSLVASGRWCRWMGTCVLMHSFESQLGRSPPVHFCNINSTDYTWHERTDPPVDHE